jgi:hypothetical protein
MNLSEAPDRPQHEQSGETDNGEAGGADPADPTRIFSNQEEETVWI